MNAEKALAAESTISLAGIITADLVPQKDRTLPRPRRILAVFLFYGSLSLIASLGQGPARFAVAAGGLVALSSLVVGATGGQIITLLRRGTGLIETPPSGLPPVNFGFGGRLFGSRPAGGATAPVPSRSTRERTYA